MTPTVDTLLASTGAVITYVPLRTEVPFRDFLSLPPSILTYEIAPRAALDPFREAEKAIATVGDQQAVILIPGRRFDAAGTRHGQGGGWYDRFLSRVPREWSRIGFCFERQFSSDPLPRESWDQAMDFVFVAKSATEGAFIRASAERLR